MGNERSHLVFIKVKSKCQHLLTRASGSHSVLGWVRFERLNEIRLSPFTTPFLLLLFKCNCYTSCKLLSMRWARDNNQKNWEQRKIARTSTPLVIHSFPWMKFNFTSISWFFFVTMKLLNFLFGIEKFHDQFFSYNKLWKKWNFRLNTPHRHDSRSIIILINFLWLFY